MHVDLTGCTALITGGSMGIGRSVAETMAQEGVNVAICARSQTKLDETAADINSKGYGGRVIAIPLDTTDWSSVKSGVDKVISEFDHLDILINGAAAPGGLVRNEIDLAEDTALLTDLDTKVIGYFRMVKACIPHMRKRKFGRIINIGGMTGRGTMALSGMRNAALSHFTKTLSDITGPNGITVNIIHPGLVETPHIHELYEMRAKKENRKPEEVEQEYIDRTPIRRLLLPEEIGHLIIFLCSPLAGGITGESIGLDGGISRYISL
jgi:NAD(P)-dependent dehydrogenase (short-subunit alcohol dehydrogenase family)